MEFQPMSPEDMQRTMQFLPRHPTQFASDLAASQARFDARTEKLAEGLIGLTAIVGQVVDNVSQLADKVSRIVDAQERTDEQLRTTESHLNVVIQMLDRHLREDHGHSPS